MSRSGGAALAVGLALLVAGCGAEDANRPNVLLVSIDTLRADHLSAYGYRRPTSPNIDRLAREGTTFPRAYAASSWTVPSHMTLLTSLPATLHGVDTMARQLDRARETLAERLRGAGYQTAAFVSGPTMHRAWGFAQGFDRYENTTAFTATDFDRGDPTQPSTRGKLRSHQAVTGPEVSIRTRRWLAEEARPPFFLFVHLWDPHYDYIPPPPWDTRFDPDYTGSFDFGNLEVNPTINSRMPARELHHLIALYDGEIGATDAVVGDVIASLAERQLLDRTLVVVTADHGEEFFEHGNKGHARTLFEEMVRVPLIFRLPGVVRAGRRPEGIVGPEDVMPTILGIVGVAPGREARGRDLGDVLRGGAGPADHWAFAEIAFNRRSPLYAARVGERKYIATVERDEPLALQVVYYDLVEDPGEQTPLPARDPEALAFVERLHARVRELRRAADTLPREGPDPDTLDAETLKHLRALGYIR